ncbi:MAG TPA: shikimate dehydrogenase [Paracoccaceae bacterium]|nr:shikimate dehydrogenase [Paracoccaceae bacterium]
MSDTDLLRLGLIGDNIAASLSPRLHELAGQLAGRPVRYDRLVPRELGLDFEALFAKAAGAGYAGLNITYPYKERVIPLVRIEDPRVARLGAVNTVLFDRDGAKGFNTDFTGFIAGYRKVLGDRAPGAVCMAGAGGVGKAVAFGLLALGLERLAIVERDLARAEALAKSLRVAAPHLVVRVTADPAEAAAGANGFVNCTPLGMVGIGGTPLPRPLLRGGDWAFDAVYTPVETPFLADAQAEGLAIMSGFELFFYQGAHAWVIFGGGPIDQGALRRAIEAEAAT